MMSAKQTHKQSPAEGQRAGTREAYEKPLLVRYGGVVDLTRGVLTTSNDAVGGGHLTPKTGGG
jgi:hypothetical protein